MTRSVTARDEAVQNASLNPRLTSLNLRFASSFLLAMTQSDNEKQKKKRLNNEY